MTPYLLATGIFFCGSFVQSAAGFGAALVVMPLLTLLVGVETAAPTHSLLVLGVSGTILMKYWRDCAWRESLRMLLVSLFFVPIGATALVKLPSEPVTGVLGLLLLAYAPYELWRSTRSTDDQAPAQPPAWAPYLAGATSGLLGGAYNTNGPPLILYAVTRRWPKHVFKATIQSVIFFQFIAIDIVHAYNGLMTDEVFRYVAAGLPGVVLGAFAGFAIDSKIDQVRFRQAVLVLVIILGVSLLYRSLP